MDEFESIPPVAPGPEAPRPGFLRSLWLGAKGGMRLASIAAAPFAALMLIPGLAITAFGLGTGRPVGIVLVVAAFALLRRLVFIFLGRRRGRGRGAGRPHGRGPRRRW